MLVETLKQHDAALAQVRAEAQAEVTQAEARVAELKQELADRLEVQAAARDDAVRGAAQAVQQYDAALAAVRAQLEASEGGRVKLDQDFAVRIDTLRREADIARSTQVAAVEKEATERLEVTRRDAESALAILAKELETQADGRVEAARHDVDTALAALEERAAAQVAAAVGAAQAEAAQLLLETRQQHDVALANVRAEAKADLVQAENRVAEMRHQLAARAESEAAARVQLEDAEAGRARLDQDLAARVEIARREAEAAHAAKVAALEARAAGQVESGRRRAEAALAAQETDLEAQAADRVVAAVRTAQAEATQILVATMKQHDVAVAAVRAEAQADLSRAEDRVTELQQDFAERVEADAAARDAALRAAAETARQFDGELVAVRAELEAAEARQVRLEQDFVVRLDTLRREADTARRAQLEAAHVQAAERLEAAVGASQAGAARKLAEAQKKHDVALASVRADAQADATRTESRLAEQQQQLVDRIAGEADARVDKLRVAAETAQQHEVALTAVRAQLEDADARRATLEEELIVRVETARREADTAHAAQVAKVEAQAAERVEAAVCASQAEAAQQLADRVEGAETAELHDTALAALGAQLEEVEARRVKLEEDLDTLRREADTAYAVQAAAAESQAEQVEAAVRTSHAEATKKLSDMQKRHNVALASVRAETRAGVSRAEDRLAEVQHTLTTTRKQAELAQAEIIRLQADRLNQRQPVRREAGGPQERQLGKLVVTRRGMADITGAVVLAGFAGTLIGWYVAFSGLL